MSGDETFVKVHSALTEIQGKKKIEQEDINNLEILLKDYTQNPNSREDARLDLSKQLDSIRARYALQK